ncbi:MAG: hypothetical protein U1E87_04695 [Alphaproteobacteria bacterium]
MSAYRDFIGKAPEALGLFVGMKAVHIDRSVPASIGASRSSL